MARNKNSAKKVECFNGNNLRWGRERLALSLERAARLCAIDPERFADFEEGRAEPQDEEFKRINDGIRMPKHVLFYPGLPHNFVYDFRPELKQCSAWAKLAEIYPAADGRAAAFKSEVLRWFDLAGDLQDNFKSMRVVSCLQQIGTDMRSELYGADWEDLKSLRDLREWLYFQHIGVFVVDFARDSFCSPELAGEFSSKVSALMLADHSENICGGRSCRSACKFKVVLLNARFSEDELFAVLKSLLPRLLLSNTSDLWPASAAAGSVGAVKAGIGSKKDEQSLSERLELLFTRPYVEDVLLLLQLYCEMDPECAASWLDCRTDELPQLQELYELLPEDDDFD